MSDKKKALLALPWGGKPDAETAIAAFWDASDDKLIVRAYPCGRSLLAYGFNHGWCEFANGDYDYFAMLHSDQYPQAMIDKGMKDGQPWRERRTGWLDVLIEELEAGEFGVMHAVAAIKDGRGMTSTAVGTPDGKWESVRRLSIKELHDLPETFGYEEVARMMTVKEVTGDSKADMGDGVFTPKNEYCLLPNTGVMVVKRSAIDLDAFPGFCISDRIIKYADGQYRPEVEPEDWAFGRWCARHGVKVGGTHKVVSHHFGRNDYSTECVWGEWDRDEHWAANLKAMQLLGSAAVPEKKAAMMANDEWRGLEVREHGLPFFTDQQVVDAAVDGSVMRGAVNPFMPTARPNQLFVTTTDDLPENKVTQGSVEGG